MTEEKKYLNIVDHYEACLEKHGDSHLGVDWPKLEDVEKRYRIMLDLIFIKEKNKRNISLLDFGCGAAHLYEFILKNKYKGLEYSGLDISSKFVELSKRKYPENQFYCVDFLDTDDNCPSFDYIVMNGVFTEKRALSFEEMFTYFTKLVSKVFNKANKGIAFNVMSKAVDWEREDLFHLSTDLLISFLTKNLTRNFVIRNDYGLYEYTVYIYK